MNTGYNKDNKRKYKKETKKMPDKHRIQVKEVQSTEHISLVPFFKFEKSGTKEKHKTG